MTDANETGKDGSSVTDTPSSSDQKPSDWRSKLTPEQVKELEVDREAFANQKHSTLDKKLAATEKELATLKATQPAPKKDAESKVPPELEEAIRTINEERFTKEVAKLCAPLKVDTDRVMKFKPKTLDEAKEFAVEIANLSKPTAPVPDGGSDKGQKGKASDKAILAEMYPSLSK